jgi:hypothetical protein
VESVVFVVGETTVPADGRQASVTIPREAVGRELVAVMATLTGRAQSMAFIEVEADPGPLGRLLVSLPTALTAVGELAAIDVKGVFDDGVVRDVSGPDRGSTYTSSDEAVLAVSPLGLVQARKRGRAEIRVTNRGRTATASVLVAVPEPPDNQIPVPDPGPDLVVAPETMVRLSAAESRDPDGDSLRYRWNQLAGPYVFLWDPDTATPHFVSPKVSAETVIELSLVVVDAKNAASFPTTLRVTVQPGAPPPVGD